MKALARIGMLVQMSSVEIDQPVRIGGEVRGNPVENHADALLVQVIDEVHEVLGRAVARRGREISGGLVAPRPVERMLGDRHQLHVREAQVEHVVGELVGDVAVIG